MSELALKLEAAHETIGGLKYELENVKEEIESLRSKLNDGIHEDAPDKEKLISYSNDLLSKIPGVKSKEAQQAIQDAANILIISARSM